jgi:nicotinate phosphoribosyltransferase
MRLDSKNPYVAGDEYIAWLKARGRDPTSKLIIPSDGLDVDDLLGLHAYFGGKISEGYTAQDFKSAKDFIDPLKWTKGLRIRDSEGWGTLATNDFRDCHPDGLTDLDPLSLVCKISSAEGRSAVKLSDNYKKATGSPERLERYRGVFGSAGMENIPVLV